MHSNIILQGLTSAGLPKLWQTAENLLNIGQPQLHVLDIKEGRLILAKTEKTVPSFLPTLGKMLAYTMFIPLATAFIVSRYYRSQYQAQIGFDPLKEQKISLPQKPAGLEEQIQKWMQNCEREWKQQPLNPILRLYEKDPSVDISSACNTLSEHLHDVSSYLASQDAVLEFLYTVHKNLLMGKDLAIARSTYKKCSAFLRRVTPDSQLAKYETKIKKDLAQPTGYLSNFSLNIFPEDCWLSHGQTLYEKHAIFTFLLSSLRKQIKLRTKRDTICRLFSRFLPVSEQTSRFLGLTWLHGTKLSTIKSACENTNSELLCTGKLEKRNATSISGEMHVGASAIGVNAQSLSGTDLSDADTAISYARRYPFILKNERECLQKFFDGNYPPSYLADYGNFSRLKQSLYRLCTYDPNSVNKQLVANKIAEIYKSISAAFVNPNVFINGELCHKLEFYSFLQSLRRIEQILLQPPTPGDLEQIELADIPIVLGSFNSYGHPPYIGPLLPDAEKLVSQPLKLGRDICVLFTEPQHMAKVQQILTRYDLQDRIEVQSFSTLKKAQQMNKRIGSYLYDAYGLKKWKREIAASH